MDMVSLTVAQEEVPDNIPRLGESTKKSLQFRVICKQRHHLPTATDTQTQKKDDGQTDIQTRDIATDASRKKGGKYQKNRQAETDRQGSKAGRH